MSRYITNIEVNGVEDVPVVVHYTTSPFHAGKTDGRGGPKLEPDEPATLEIEQVFIAQDGREIILTLQQKTALEEEIVDWLSGRWDEDPPDHYFDD